MGNTRYSYIIPIFQQMILPSVVKTPDSLQCKWQRWCTQDLSTPMYPCTWNLSVKYQRNKIAEDCRGKQTVVYSLLHALTIISILLIPSAPFDFQYVIFHVSVYKCVCKFVLQTLKGCVESCHTVFVRVYYESHCFLFHILAKKKYTYIYGSTLWNLSTIQLVYFVTCFNER